MGTKNNPGEFDCYANALPDEPIFILLARDPNFARFVRQWALDRTNDIECGERPLSDMAKVNEVLNLAKEGEIWRRENFGKWRQPKE